MPGLLGADKGKGGKYLILPPGYSETVPDGYIALQSDTFGSYALLRSNLESHSDADVAKSVAYGKRIKIYPLSQAANPPPNVFTDAKDVLFDSTIRYDASFFDRSTASCRANLAAARPRDDRSAEVARHREGQAFQARRQDQGGSSRPASAKRRRGSRPDTTRVCRPSYRGRPLDLPGAARARPGGGRRTSTSRTPIRSMPAASPTATRLSASSASAPASST